MDPRLNPYTPNAGARPPVLAGRADLLTAFDILLARLLRGRTERSMIISGLRGVGKTVLLGELRGVAEITAGPRSKLKSPSRWSSAPASLS